MDVNSTAHNNLPGWSVGTTTRVRICLRQPRYHSRSFDGKENHTRRHCKLPLPLSLLSYRKWRREEKENLRTITCTYRRALPEGVMVLAKRATATPTMAAMLVFLPIIMVQNSLQTCACVQQTRGGAARGHGGGASEAGSLRSSRWVCTCTPVSDDTITPCEYGVYRLSRSKLISFSRTPCGRPTCTKLQHHLLYLHRW